MYRVLIAGCGFVGKRAARLFAQAGHQVTGVVRSEGSVQNLTEEPEVVACDITNPEEVHRKLASPHPQPAISRSPQCLGGFDLIINCASSNRGGAGEYRKVYLEGTRNLLALKPKKFIFTSSTSVYPQSDKEWVTEESPAEPDLETGEILKAAEDLVLAEPGGIVARLGGIYGPGRSIYLKRFFEGTAVIEGDGGRFLNQIHAEDAASALYFLGQPDTNWAGPALFNVCDSKPLSQLECYRWLANHFGKPLPPSGPVMEHRKRGNSNKRVSSAKLQALAWSPRYPSFTQAVESDQDLLAGFLGEH